MELLAKMKEDHAVEVEGLDITIGELEGQSLYLLNPAFPCAFGVELTSKPRYESYRCSESLPSRPHHGP